MSETVQQSPEPAMSERVALPPLPMPWRKVPDADGIPIDIFRAFQMRDYARAALAAHSPQAAEPAPIPQRLELALRQREFRVPDTLDEAIKSAANIICEDGAIIKHLQRKVAATPQPVSGSAALAQPAGGEVATLAEQFGLTAMAPACWTLTETLDKGETTVTGRLWFSNPGNSAWEPLYRRAALLRLLGHAKAVQQHNAELIAAQPTSGSASCGAAVTAVPIVWEQSYPTMWVDGRYGYTIMVEDGEYTAALGEGDADSFPTLEAAQAWCQEQIDKWIASSVVLGAPASAPVSRDPMTDAEFEAWWQSEGQFTRAGGGDYEKSFAYQLLRRLRATPAAAEPVKGDAP